MGPVGKAIWFVESHYADAVSLDDIAEASGVSRFHLSRAFSYTLGVPVMGYLRARRLTEAAKRLAGGEPEILNVALSVGYGSHEAFTRAFRDQFGVTPEEVRKTRSTKALRLTETHIMENLKPSPLAAPRMADGKAMLIAGLAQRNGCQPDASIPAQWQRFAPYIGAIPGEVGEVAYGVIYNADDEGNHDYMCGVEVSDFTNAQPELTRLRIPAARYIVFRHDGHIAGIRGTFEAIWSEGLAASGHQAADAPFFERYGPEFDPMTGRGGLEIWIPVKG